MANFAIKGNDKPALIWLAIISSLTHLAWLLVPANFTSGDWWYIGIERYKDFAQFSPIWVTDGLGTTSAVPHFYLIRFLEGILTHVGSSFALNEKLFFLIPMTFAATFGAYFLLRHYFRSWPAFIGAIVFAFNTPMLFNHVGPLTIGTAYCLAPWCIYFFKRFLDEPTGKRVIAVALTFAAVAVYELRIALIIIAICLGLFVFTVFAGEGWRYARRRLLPLAGVLAIVVLLHAFWIVPYAVSSRAVTFSDLLSRGLFVSFSDVQNALTLYHPFWTGARPATFVVQAIPLYAWIIPVAAVAGFVLRGKKTPREMYFWGIVAVAGLFLVKQVNEPFVNVYPWLFGHVPGFGAYRESSKFYLLVALAYAVLIPFALVALKDVVRGRLGRRGFGLTPGIISGVAAAAVLGIFVINMIPLLTGSFRTLYIPRTMPQDYKTLEKFVSSQPEQFRTLWVPVTSRWGIMSNKHPAMLATSVNQGGWLQRIGAGEQNTYATLRDKAIRLFQQPTSNDALDRAGVKYVIVPLRDTANEDDFFRYYGDDRQYYIDQLDRIPYLKKVNIGTHEIVVYENTHYQPYISSTDNLQSFALEDTTDITTFQQFITQQTKKAFNFIDSASVAATNAGYPTTSIQNVFQDISARDVSQQRIRKTIPAADNPVLYINPNNRHVRYQLAGNTITFFAWQQANLEVNGKALDQAAANETVVGSTTLDPAAKHYLSVDDKPLELPLKEGSRDLGVISQSLSIYTASGKNIVPNPSFEQGTWQAKVEDCNNYDKQPLIAMGLKGGDATHGGRALQLAADRHTACTTSNKLPSASTAQYLLGFDYKVSSGRTTGYELRFDDPKQSVIKEDLAVNDARWHHYQKLIQLPPGATTVQVRLLGYPDYRMQNHAVTTFDLVSLTPLKRSLQLADTGQAPYQQLPLPAKQQLTFTYPNQAREQSNRIGNGSFEQGTWQRKVADCNDYDDNPVLGMQLIGRGNGKALELAAQKHDACTSNSRTSVHENTNYMLSFDYQSPNAPSASYFVRFNDPAQTTLEETLPIKDSNWQTYARQIKAPLGATRMNIVVYARSAESGGTTILNRYDSFTLREIPDLPNRYFVVSRPSQRVTTPQEIQFTSHSATKKSIQVRGASKPFYLTMNEAFHPLWKVRPGTAQAGDWLTQSPLRTASFLPESKHFKLNDFANGWYIDPAAICKTSRASCTQMRDGSYNLQLVVEFLPQRWFYFGGMMSLCTLAGISLYLVFRIRQGETRIWQHHS